MSSVNKVIIICRVGKDPEIRAMQNGGEVASLSVATSEHWKDKASGERREATEWHKVSIFNEHLVRVVRDFVKKGAQVYIEGQLKTRKYQDKEGRDCYTTEIVLQGFNGQLVLLGGGKEQSAHDEAKQNAYVPNPLDDCGIPF